MSADMLGAAGRGEGAQPQRQRREAAGPFFSAGDIVRVFTEMAASPLCSTTVRWHST